MAFDRFISWNYGDDNVFIGHPGIHSALKTKSRRAESGISPEQPIINKAI